ncbi:MAG: Uma2 family endonuclease [Chloroflexaceae bacterium]|jgi:Uma2 family endonuclease|nr:Uma2 family endonuclease [Chloroflexaceae bacterium]
MIDRFPNPTLVLRSLDANWNYERWERELPNDGNRYEVIHGVLYRTSVPSNFHQWVVRRLGRFVGVPLDDAELAYVFNGPIGVLMPGCEPVQPDFVLVRREHAAIITDKRIRGVPDLIAEVLSPNNQEQDTETKRRAYARADVPEYWIVRPQTRDVLVCRDPDATLGDYTTTQLLGSDADLAPLHFPVSLRIADLFSGAPDTTL